MNIDLLRSLLANNVVKFGSEMEARYNALDFKGSTKHIFTGDFIVMGSEDKGDTIVMHLACAKFGTRRKIDFKDVLSIDGMPAERLAIVYNIGPNGEKVKAATRRGRKPKGWSEDDEF